MDTVSNTIGSDRITVLFSALKQLITDAHLIQFTYSTDHDTMSRGIDTPEYPGLQVININPKDIFGNTFDPKTAKDIAPWLANAQRVGWNDTACASLLLHELTHVAGNYMPPGYPKPVELDANGMEFVVFQLANPDVPGNPPNPVYPNDSSNACFANQDKAYGQGIKLISNSPLVYGSYFSWISATGALGYLISGVGDDGTTPVTSKVFPVANQSSTTVTNVSDLIKVDGFTKPPSIPLDRIFGLT